MSSEKIPAEAQAQGGGEVVAWDNGSPCLESRPIGMVYPVKPAPRASGYLDSSGVEWSAYDTGQMEAYARAAYSDGWSAGYRAALAQQPAAVDRARFRKAPCYLCGYGGAGYFQPETHPCAALYHAAQQGGRSDGQ